LQGTLVVIGSPNLLLNDALRDDRTARFVYRQVVQGAATIAFDEAHHSYVPPNATAAPASLNQLLLTTAAGRALIYVAAVTFVFVLLNGRRLGPAVVARGPTETRRTMYEHVQMLANLYRRADQFPVLRAALARHYSRLLARRAVGTPGAAALSEALARMETARSEPELLAALAAAEREQ
jgi:hypothetical protein